MSKLEDDFAFLDDWEEKYDYIINTLAPKVPPMDEKDKTEENIVDGCMSQVWLKMIKRDDGTYVFSADSDSIIVKGLIYILMDIFSGKTANDIKNTDVTSFFDKIGINAHLTLKRRNGLYAMVEKIKRNAV